MNLENIKVTIDVETKMIVKFVTGVKFNTTDDDDEGAFSDIKVL